LGWGGGSGGSGGGGGGSEVQADTNFAIALFIFKTTSTDS
jgi:hypothetical protein